MDRHVMHMKAKGIDADRIGQAANHIFDYLSREKFSLMETQCLLSSMGLIMSDMTKKDPLRKVDEFNYSSCIESMFSCTAASNTES